MSESKDTAASESPILDLDFAPDWARKPATGNFYEERERPRRGRDGERRDRKSRGPRRDDAGPARGGKRPPRGNGGGRGRPEGRKGPRHERGERPPRPQPIEPAAVDVRFLPDRETLQRVALAVSKSKRAVPLMHIAGQFLSRPEACQVLLHPAKKQWRMRFYQCPVCRSVSTDRKTVEEHLLRRHLETYFDREDREGEPPKGNFVCVARCGLSGELLGPPNHHSYRTRMEEIRRTRYPQMSADEYQGHVRTVRDEEVVAEWKENAQRQTIYRLKGVEDAPELDWAAAIAHVRQDVLPDAIKESKSATLPALVARELEDRALFAAIRNAWHAEEKFPRSLLFALRGAMGHMRLNIFRVKGRTEYASPIAPARLEGDAIVPEVGAVLKHISDHPGCSRADLRAGLHPELKDDDKEGLLKFFHPLAWLVDRGHVIEFFDGSLAVPTHSAPPRAAAEKKPARAKRRPRKPREPGPPKKPDA